MNVLIACEESQEVCKAFRERGHRAFSCDIQEPSGGHPEWHILGDCLPLINGRCKFRTMDGKCHEQQDKWDLLIAHPPCTYLSNAGATRLYHGTDVVVFQSTQYRLMNEERIKNGILARDFFMAFLGADCEKVVIENPIPSKLWMLPKYTQTIQPYEYGHPYTKKTCLWIKGVAKLKPTKIVKPEIAWVSSGSDRTRKIPGALHRDSKTRAKTFFGIARAMAEQWG